ncbi:FRG domain-containing protein [Streptococcus oralis]|uniref:FRG domain-containing protein n=1 Tax=Streptococcus oralis TaxID=1303 RepID=UPI0022836E26|nr:FRG domain-containing protein [Streptococcus oralis]MCY7102381.1 FRG domain-containing protein [Streptococcus oralis]
MRTTVFIKVKEFLSDKTEPSLEKIHSLFSEDELNDINETTPEDFLRILGIEDKEIEENYKNVRALIFDSNLQKDTREEPENIEETNIKDYLFKKFKLEVSHFENDLIVLKKNDSLIEASEQFVQWNGEPDVLIRSFASRYGIPEDKVFVVQNLTEYIQVITEFNQEGHFLLSRGQKDCTFDLVPSVFRYKAYEMQEKELVDRFIRNASFYDKAILSKSKESVTAYAQHYGLPTKYLDFTEAHLLSLFFALEEFDYKDKPSVVYFVATEEYHNEIIKTREPFFDFSDEKSVNHYRDGYSKKDVFIKLEDSNERIHFQKGYFLKAETKLSDNIKTMLKEYTYCVLIPQEVKETLFNELFNIGITYESIYPDIDNLVKNIKHRK